jgi:hypothetical protein
MVETDVFETTVTGSGDILPIPSSEDSLTVAGTAVRGTTTPINTLPTVTS